MSDEYAPIDPKEAIVAFNRGAAAMANGDEESAVRAWHLALELDPALVTAAINLVTYYQGQDDLQTELKLWDIVLAFDPFDTDQLVLQAAAFRKAGRLRRAIENYQRAIAIYPYYKFWYQELAAIYREVGEVEEAALWSSRGDSLEADAAEMCYQDGVRQAGEERWDSARTCFVAVLDDFPANLDARLRLAEVLVHCGTADEVIQQYELALEMTSVAKALVSFKRGQYHLKQGETAQAAAAFRAALEATPVYRKAARVLGAIEQTGRGTAPPPPPPPPPAPPSQVVAAVDAPSAAASRGSAAEWAEPRDEHPEHRPELSAPLLQPDEIGMEKLDSWPPASIPSFRPPNPRLPWQHQLKQVLDQVLSIAAPGGTEPRVALVVEPDGELAEIASHTLSELCGMGRSLRADRERSHIFVVETDKTSHNGSRIQLHSGWLGQDEVFTTHPSQWARGRPGFSLRSTLSAVERGAGSHGFNCLVVISLGRCHGGHFNPRAALSQAQLYSFCFLHPSYHYVDVRLAIANACPNFLDISA